MTALPVEYFKFDTADHKAQSIRSGTDTGREGQFHEEMFKKRRNKAKEDVLIVDNKKRENRSSKISTDSTFADENANGEFTFSDRCDQTDGFDSQGFVDLAPAENQPQLLGPKQNCQVSAELLQFYVFLLLSNKRNFKKNQVYTRTTSLGNVHFS